MSTLERLQQELLQLEAFAEAEIDRAEEPEDRDKLAAVVATARVASDSLAKFRSHHPGFATRVEQALDRILLGRGSS